ncbi:MAG TPA: extracellular solute-binding protein [Candidatus Blautia stercoripullorum]|uniref:Extracellular solute-binding protein n=1 Tax=Candidatus Blautia stercoripullorum TaxID=2838502 RepID=A0A9D2R9E9_9FIRM|nr:extracellular solute-binding protein [Candidatus Blautia stercoripullorum]
MRKKFVSLLMAGALTAGMLTGCSSGGGSGSGSEGESASSDGDYDLTLYSINTTDPEFDDWLANVEEATGLNINVIAAPTDSDTRQQKITTILSTGDSSVDIIEINDEMSSAFKNSGWLEGLNDTVMTEDIVDYFAQGYVENMITDNEGNIIGVPGYTGYLAFWVNQEIMDEAGITSIDTKEDFMKYMEAVSGDGRYGYGGSWEKTYVFNEIAQFVNMFGGDYFDWTLDENKEAIQFLYDMVQNGQTPIDQIADKYEQMNPKAIDGKYGCWFYWGLGPEYETADMLGEDKIHMAMVPDFSGNGERYIFTDSWNYVLNSASENKEAAVKFLQYMADEGGMEASYQYFDRYPARTDVAEKIVPDTDPAKEIYSRYATECTVSGRPMLPQTMEFITDMGTIFQSCMQGNISVDEFCTSAQELVEKYSA